jgi:hypothetical protein
MNTEDDEFNRIEREAKARMMAVQYARQRALQRLHDENVRLDLYSGVYTSPIPLITDEEWEALNAKEE